MIATHRLHVVTAACATTLLAGVLAAVAFGAGSASAESADTSANTGSDATTYNVLDVPSAQSGIALKDKAYSKDGPIVTELADGRFVQRTPSENISADYDAEGAYSHRERVCQDDFCKFSKFKYLSAEKSPNISCLHIS